MKSYYEIVERRTNIPNWRCGYNLKLENDRLCTKKKKKKSD